MNFSIFVVINTFLVIHQSFIALKIEGANKAKRKNGKSEYNKMNGKIKESKRSNDI